LILRIPMRCLPFPTTIEQIPQEEHCIRMQHFLEGDVGALKVIVGM
jgi:hypothetical protein